MHFSDTINHQFFKTLYVYFLMLVLNDNLHIAVENIAFKYALLARNIEVCPVVLRFLIELYTNQKLRIKWGFSISELFCLKNGVKQGGVLSPVLFSIYFDELMTRLRTCW